MKGEMPIKKTRLAYYNNSDCTTLSSTQKSSFPTSCGSLIYPFFGYSEDNFTSYVIASFVTAPQSPPPNNYIQQSYWSNYQCTLPEAITFYTIGRCVQSVYYGYKSAIFPSYSCSEAENGIVATYFTTQNCTGDGQEFILTSAKL